jgi:hypothetical protein
MTQYWKDILNNWDNGKFLEMPKYISKPFYWRTNSVKNQNSVYLDEFVETNSLPSKNSYQAFLDPPISLKKSKNSIIVAPNLSHDTILIIPQIDKNNTLNELNYSSLFYFMKNAPKAKQIQLWKTVSFVIKKQLPLWKNLWVSVHGNGVGYLHIRISKTPKYYGNSILATL